MKRSSESDKGPIYTIGYGARLITDFIDLLQHYRIDYLLDIRSRPYSKFTPDFAKSQLEAHLSAAGIQYVFMGDTLGGMPEDRSCYDQEGKVDYEKVKDKDFYRLGIERLRDAWEQELRVALMCSEGKPERCHRSKLIGVTLDEADIPVAHFDENGELKTQQEVLLRLTDGQIGLPGFNPGYTSRKAYHPSGEQDEPIEP